MKELTTYEEVKSLEKGEKIYKVSGGMSQGFKVVGTMPGNDNYVIISAGEDLKHIHKSHLEGHRRTVYYTGEYDPKVLGKKMIEQLQMEIEDVEAVYIKGE